MNYIIEIMGIFCIIGLSWNILQYYKIGRSKLPLSYNWYSYSSAEIYAHEQIYSQLISEIKVNDIIWVSMFMWLYKNKADLNNPNLQSLELKLVQYLEQCNVTGTVFVDAIDFGYEVTPEKIAHHPLVRATHGKLRWEVNYQPNSLPNNLLMWLFHTPWLQNTINNTKYTILHKIYALLKLSSNHQKILIINEGQKACIGSRNFNCSNWNNKDMLLVFQGIFAKVIYQAAAKTIANLNPRKKALVDSVLSTNFKIKPINIDLSRYTSINKMARVLNTAEIKPTILYLINQSREINAELAILTDTDIINALNNFLLRGGKLRLILDTNNYMFSFKTYNMPNVIPIVRLLSNAQVGIYNSSFQMHTKMALFNLANGNTVLLGGSANWSHGALRYFAFNDMNFIVLNDNNLNQRFMEIMDRDYKECVLREQVRIPYKLLKICLTRIMLTIGINSW
ncbi:MAG: phospholipase D family protein [Burkholderiales bacterium]|nr:phospholipase D family protein [Burkholderiales bacterium]